MTKETDRRVENFTSVMRGLHAHGMHGIYTVLCAIARSVRHLEELHGRLPDNQRLLRDDFIALKKAWQEMRDPKHVSPTLFTSVLTGIVHAPKADLTEYYLNVLDLDREERSQEELGILTRTSEIVFSCQERYGHGYEHFALTLHGHEFRVGCKFVGDTLVIRVVIWSRELTEELTHKLLETPAIRRSIICKSSVNSSRGRTYSSSEGQEVDFYFLADGTLFKEVGAVSDLHSYRARIAQGRLFLGTLAMCLRGFGLPFTRLGAIVPWNEETCLPFSMIEEGGTNAEHRSWGLIN